MSNMSYCRFQNTLGDLLDCRRVLEGMVDGDEAPLSPDELEAAETLVDECLRIVIALAEAGETALGEIGEDDDTLRQVLGLLNERAEELEGGSR